MPGSPDSAAQQNFDRRYISGLEIRKRLNVAHCSLSFAQQRGDLPAPIVVGGGVYVWDRACAEPYLQEWERKLKARREKRA